MSITELDIQGDLLIYKGVDGSSHIDVHIEGETLWLTQAQMVKRTPQIIIIWMLL